MSEWIAVSEVELGYGAGGFEVRPWERRRGWKRVYGTSRGRVSLVKQTCHTRHLRDWKRRGVEASRANVPVWLVGVVGHNEGRRRPGLGTGIIILGAAAGGDRRQLGPAKKQRDKVMRSAKLAALVSKTGHPGHACSQAACWGSVDQAPPCSGAMGEHGACSGLALVTRMDGRRVGLK